ncbi:MAG: HTH domain-containing protein [bacterium]
MRVKFQSIRIIDEKGMNYASVNVFVNVPVNKGQKWFLEQLNEGVSVKAADISKKFNVSLKTARRDIKNLVDHQVVEFSGAPKTGQYILLRAPSNKKALGE